MLKDIILVFASIAIWGTPVTGLQFFGYSISLAGMVWFKLGGDAIKSYIAEGGRQWAEYGAKRPVQRKVVIFLSVILTLVLVLAALAPAAGVDTAALAGQGKGYVAGLLGGGTGAVTDTAKQAKGS